MVVVELYTQNEFMHMEYRIIKLMKIHSIIIGLVRIIHLFLLIEHQQLSRISKRLS